MIQHARQKISSVEVVIRDGLHGLTPARVVTLYRRAPLMRAVFDPDRVWKMFEKASLVLTAWKGDHLVGIARVLTDGVMFSYLCDLAVEPDVQGLGIGKRLVHEVLDRCKGTEIIARGADINPRFYTHFGFEREENAWLARPE